MFNSNTWTHHLGVYVASSGANNYLNGCISDFCFVDGQQLTPTSFGETDTDTGEWRMKDFSASDITWGTNGYRILKDGNSLDGITELGQIISGKIEGRVSQEHITIADLTGVAVQDIQISKAVLKNL